MPIYRQTIVTKSIKCSKIVALFHQIRHIYPRFMEKGLMRYRVFEYSSFMTKDSGHSLDASNFSPDELQLADTDSANAHTMTLYEPGAMRIGGRMRFFSNTRISR